MSPVKRWTPEDNLLIFLGPNRWGQTAPGGGDNLPHPAVMRLEEAYPERIEARPRYTPSVPRSKGLSEHSPSITVQ